MKLAESLLQIVRDFYPYDHSVVFDDSPKIIEKYGKYLPFEIFTYASGAAVNGWVVPNNWRPRCARIFSSGELYYDAMLSPIGVGVLSPSFSGPISRVELTKHLFYSDENPAAVPYHWTNLYRPAERQWAICVPKAVFDSLPEDDLYVELVTEEEPGEMYVLDFFLPGESSETIILNAHSCHPWQANDDLSGVSVGIAAMQELLSRKRRRYSYRLLIAPELIGPVHWLHHLDDGGGSIIGAILLKAVGNDSNLKLQNSFTGRSFIDKAAHLVFKERFMEYVSGGFREIYGNDETVFDSPGYEIPSISLTRFPFLQYHTDADTPESLSEGSLREVLVVTLELIDILERDRRFIFAHRGLISLSNPRYDLYIPAPAPGIDRQSYRAEQGDWNLLMNCLPRELDGQRTVVDIAEKYGVSFHQLSDYLEKWHEKGLVVQTGIDD